MKFAALALTLIASLPALSNAEICDIKNVPRHAVTSDGRVSLEVLFKPNTDMRQAVLWASAFGQATRASRRVAGLQVLVRCVEVVEAMAKNENVQSISYSPPAPVFFGQGNTVKPIFNRLQK